MTTNALPTATLLTEAAPQPHDAVGPLSAPVRLRADHHRAGATVLGGTGATPALSWEMPTAPAGWEQAAAEIEVTHGPVGGPTITESVVLDGPSTLFSPWPLTPLASRERATWRVRVTGTDGTVSDWSAPAVVETGLLERSDWSARPITAPGNTRTDPAPVLVRRLTVPEGTTAARLHLTAGGTYEAFIDGVKVGTDELAPGWTEYRDRLLVQTHDVTTALTPGEHEVAVVLGNGWYRGHLTWAKREAVYGDRLWLLAQLELTGPDGTTTVGTDERWTWRPSNVSANDLYDGQDVDLRLPALGSADAEAQVELLPLPEQALEPTTLQMPTVIGEVRPVEVITTPSGRTVLDLGQNLTGHVRLTVTGEAGTVLTLRHAEVLERGEMGMRPLRGAACTDRVTLSGGHDVVAFTLTQHGFRYVEVDGFPGDGETLAQAVTARVVSSGMERAAWFDSSHALVNRLVENTRWSTIDNFITVPTDCPQRDERLGWTGDIGAFAPTSLSLYDAAGFLASWAKDLAWAQTPDGAMPVVSPDVLGGTKLTCAWGDAITLVPWAAYEATGDPALLASTVEAMARFVDGVAAVAGPSRLWRGGFQFGDWLDPDAAPDNPADAKADPDVVATAYFARSAAITARAFAVLGEAGRAAHYEALSAQVRRAYLDAYVTTDGLMLSDCATVYAQALAWDLLDTPRRVAGAGQRLADLVRLRSFRISTGFVGTPLVPAALVKGGQAATAVRLVLERQCPSWLYPVTMGATTIWERWDSMLPTGEINPGEMTSFNHYALGAVTQWLITDLAGLAVAAPGGTALRVAPVVGHGFSHASVVRRLPVGTARVEWALDGDRLEVRVEVPVGARAELALPGAEPETVGHGRHERTVTVPAEVLGRSGAPVMTVRDLIDDEEAWTRCVEAAAGTHGAYMEDPAATLTRFLTKELDTTARIVPGAATMYGFIPGMEETAAALTAVIDEVAPQAAEVPAAQRG
ncbi:MULTISPECIES: alpha-L-rhamnosidase [Actinomyces]|uniref:alpha-L-rhamnosidase n=1 Tax=Actinomyces respiraculi TaxID=2744574 RepID=A0A7T0LL08_9ACTO|nr:MULTISPECIES: alpha-L-rhamnosidase [Actinomyces]QPL05278.1 family 78 glycoside hydrolase catalytic domain [Actinomyces respiraculi]